MINKNAMPDRRCRKFFGSRMLSTVVICYVFIAPVEAGGIEAYGQTAVNQPFQLQGPRNTSAIWRQCELKKKTNSGNESQIYSNGEVTAIYQKRITDSVKAGVNCDFSISKVNFDDEGVYEWILTDENGSRSSFIFELQVFINPVDSELLHCPQDVVTTLGSQTQFILVYHNNATSKWLRKDESQNIIDTIGLSDGSLSADVRYKFQGESFGIDNVGLEDAGFYYFALENSNLRGNVTMTVSDANFNCSCESIVTIKCVMRWRGNNPISYHLQTDNGELTGDQYDLMNVSNDVITITVRTNGRHLVRIGLTFPRKRCGQPFGNETVMYPAVYGSYNSKCELFTTDDQSRGNSTDDNAVDRALGIRFAVVAIVDVVVVVVVVAVVAAVGGVLWCLKNLRFRDPQTVFTDVTERCHGLCPRLLNGENQQTTHVDVEDSESPNENNQMCKKDGSDQAQNLPADEQPLVETA